MSSILFTFIKIFYFYLTIKRRRSHRPNATTLMARKGLRRSSTGGLMFHCVFAISLYSGRSCGSGLLYVGAFAVVRFASFVVGRSGLCRQFGAGRGGRRKVYRGTALPQSSPTRPNHPSSVFEQYKS